jgi:hypothetical protein
MELQQLDERKEAVAAYALKKVNEVKARVRLVKTNQYAYIQKESSYKMSDAVKEIWDAL